MTLISFTQSYAFVNARFIQLFNGYTCIVFLVTCQLQETKELHKLQEIYKMTKLYKVDEISRDMNIRERRQERF